MSELFKEEEKQQDTPIIEEEAAVGILEVNAGDFILRKIKIDEARLCKVEFEIIKFNGTETPKTALMSMSPSWPCNEMMAVSIQGIKEALCEVHNKPEDKYSQINVTELRIKGNDSDKNRNFQIVGVETSASEQVLKLETHVIRFDSQVFGFEEFIKEQVDVIERLAHKYLFVAETDQLEFDLNSKPPVPEEEENNDEDSGSEGNVIDSSDIPNKSE